MSATRRKPSSKIVVVVEKNAASAVRQNGEQVGLSGRRRRVDQDLVRREARALSVGVCERSRDVQPASIQRVDDDLRAQSAIDDVGVFVLQLRSDESGRNQDDAALARHPGYLADDILQQAERNATFVVTRTQYACTGTLHQRCGHLLGHLRGIAGRWRAACNRILDGSLRCLSIVLVDDQICLVVADIRTIVPNTAGDGTGLETKQGGVELGVIVGKIQRRLARCGEDGCTIGGPQGGQVAFCCFPHSREIAEFQVDIVEQVSHETLGHRSGVPGIRRSIGG